MSETGSATTGSAAALVLNIRVLASAEREEPCGALTGPSALSALSESSDRVSGELGRGPMQYLRATA